MNGCESRSKTGPFLNSSISLPGKPISWLPFFHPCLPTCLDSILHTFLTSEVLSSSMTHELKFLHLRLLSTLVCLQPRQLGVVFGVICLDLPRRYINHHYIKPSQGKGGISAWTTSQRPPEADNVTPVEYFEGMKGRQTTCFGLYRQLFLDEVCP